MACTASDNFVARRVAGDGNVERAPDRAPPGDVFDRFVDQRRVGNRHQVIGGRAELRAAEADVFDDAVEIAERDPLAEPHRPLGQHDQAADEVVDERLAAEADADRERHRRGS